MSNTLNISEILNLVDETNKSSTSQVYIPSLRREVPIKLLNASHLKNIIKTTVSGILVSNNFNQTIYRILKEILTQDENVSVDNLTTLDKNAIILQLRKLNIKNSFLINFNYKNDSEEYEIALDVFIDKMKKTNFDFSDETFTDGAFEVTVNYPSLSDEHSFNVNFEQTKMKKVDEKDKESIKELLGPMFIQEITQYIKSIKINDSVIDFSELSVGNRLSIVEKLPGVVITKIISKIDSKFGKQSNDLLTTTLDIGGNTYKGKVDISPTLFS